MPHQSSPKLLTLYIKLMSTVKKAELPFRTKVLVQTKRCKYFQNPLTFNLNEDLND